jgi:capsular exopolysaccharide synthesis family protein
VNLRPTLHRRLALPLENAPGPARQEWALASYLAAIRAHWLAVVLITLAAVGASLAFLTLRSEEYEATAELLVQAQPQDDETFLGLPLLRDTGDPTRTVQTAAALVESQGPRVGAAIEVNPEGESNILAVTATADTPERAAALANEYARGVLDARAELIEAAADTLVAQLDARLDATPSADQVTRAELTSRLDQVRAVAQTGDPTLVLSQEAVPPASPTGSPAALIVILALIGGFTVGAGTAVLLELINRRVRDEDEALEVYPLPVLARVPMVPARSRQGPPGSTWYMPPEIREPFRTVVVQLEQSRRRVGAVMMTSPTKGDGKTTSAINLAVSLAAAGKRVVVLDFDLRHPQLSAGLGIPGGHRLSELIDPGTSLHQLLVRPSELRSLTVLPVAFHPDETALTDSVAWRLPEFIEQARQMADYVIIDTPPLGEVSDALMLARVVDEIIVVMRPGNTQRSHLFVVRELLERIGHTPEGCIIIGAPEVGGRGYRGYGYGPGGAPDLVVRDGPPERAAARALGE